MPDKARSVLWVRFWPLVSDCRGQDLIEYSLLAAFVAVAVAAILPPEVAPALSNIFSKVSSLLMRSPN